MDEQKISKKFWWIGGALVVAFSVGKYFLLIRKNKGTVKNRTQGRGGGHTEPKYVRADLFSQFALKLGDTAYLENECLKIKFVRAEKAGKDAASDDKPNLVGTVLLEATEEAGGITGSTMLELHINEGSGRSDLVSTEDKLSEEYKIRLLEIVPPRVGGDIPESNDCRVHLVVLKEKK